MFIHLLLICRAIYNHLLPRFYKTLVVRTAPLPACIHNPSLLRYSTTLIVLPAKSRKTWARAQRSTAVAAIAAALDSFHNLETLYLLTRPSSTILNRANGHHLTSLTCEGDALDHYTPNQWRLRSLSVHGCQPGPALAALLSANSDTLEYLALGNCKDRGYESFPAMPEVRTLILIGWNAEVIGLLGVAIRFDSLETLQLVEGQRTYTPQSAYTPLKAAGGLAGLRKLSIQQRMHDASAVLGLTGVLEELHLAWTEEGQADDKQLLLRAISSRCPSLKALTCTCPSIFMHNTERTGWSFLAKDLEVIAAGCEGLEDVRIAVRHDNLQSMIAALGLFTKLRYLHIDVGHDLCQEVPQWYRWQNRDSARKRG